ncbi:hypothetical protein AB3S75_033727 [Citrus x aurantiifolia]
MVDATPVLTLLPINSSSLTITSGIPLSDPSQFHVVVESLQYLSLTRLDISFIVNKMAQFMHQPTDEHWVLVKRILRYLCGTLDKGLLLYHESPLSLHGFSDALHTFSDADWAEAKYRSVAATATTAAELRWVCSLLAELGVTLQSSLVVYCDNIGATQLSSNHVFHSRMKHVTVDYHFIREHVQSGLLRVAHVSSVDQLADLLTKPLPRSQFLLLRDKIGLSTRGLS